MILRHRHLRANHQITLPLSPPSRKGEIGLELFVFRLACYIGLIGLWNHADWRGDIYTSRLIIVIAYLARFAPVAALLLAASVRQIPASFEEVAVSAAVANR